MNPNPAQVFQNTPPVQNQVPVYQNGMPYQQQVPVYQNPNPVYPNQVPVNPNPVYQQPVYQNNNGMYANAIPVNQNPGYQNYQQYPPVNGNGQQQVNSIPPVVEHLPFNTDKKIERIMVFYSDKTFSTYTPEQ